MHYCFAVPNGSEDTLPVNVVILGTSSCSQNNFVFFSRQQQQLYAEIDDLPPVEEIESDRQQRVYRGQPSTIGQVQKDRDGYGSQAISSGRTVNSNIIPASLPQAGKIGSFSFGSQIDDRRAATITPAPQKYKLVLIFQ